MSWLVFILLCLQETLRRPLLCCASTESLLGTLCANSVEAGATAATQQLPGGGGETGYRIKVFCSHITPLL